MLSAFIPSGHSYPAVPLARQLVHHRSVHPGPLVLGTEPLKYPTPTTDRDRPVSRRSKPSSRTALIGELPDPWGSSVTVWEETAPVKLPAYHCSGPGSTAPG